MTYGHTRWLFAALCCSVGIGCSHSRCHHCGSAGGHASTPAPVVAVKPVPGADKTYEVVSKSLSDGPVAKPAAEAPTPRVLDPEVTQNRPAEPAPPQPGAAKVQDPAREHRDPASGMIRFDHARDFSWIVGRLEYLHSKRQWRVRYTPADVEDAFGGVVIITGVDHLVDQFKEGATVRIQGQLVDPEGQRASPEYYVYDVRLLQR